MANEVQRTNPALTPLAGDEPVEEWRDRGAPGTMPGGMLPQEAVEEWGSERQGAPRTIAAAVWAPPEEAFQRAIARMFVAFQPVVRLTTQSIYGYEALLRSSDSLLSDPRLLVDAAERSGHLHELAEKVRSLVAAAAQSVESGPLLFINL